MDKKSILDVLNTVPMAEFELETTGGKRIPLPHRDCLMFSPDASEVMVWNEQAIELTPVNQIASIHIVRQKHKKAA